MARSKYRILSLSIHRPRFLTRPPSLGLGVYFLSSRIPAVNNERNIIALPLSLSSSALDDSCELRVTSRPRIGCSVWLVVTAGYNSQDPYTPAAQGTTQGLS